MPDNTGYFTEDHDYCYPGTSTLINKLDITNQYELEKIEQKLVSLRLAELNKTTFTFPFSTKYLTEIHRYLFQDLYAWAGIIRTVRLSKENIMFAYPENIERELNKHFRDLKIHDFFQRRTKLEFASLITDFKTELNCIHPFRDGNGRAIRKLIEDISYKA